MTILHKKMIVDNSKVNIGPVKTFRMVKEYVGGYENIGASKEDFKNFQRDLKAYIEGSDAHMFVDNFKNKKLLWSTAFYFDYEVDEEGCLCRALWETLYVGKIMLLATWFLLTPHTRLIGITWFLGYSLELITIQKCITFAAAFIGNENIVSFEWLFKSLITATGGNEPTCLITDQDPAMKIAIEKQ